MTENISAADALNSEIDDAKGAGNSELAQALYARQQGVEDLGDDDSAVGEDLSDPGEDVDDAGVDLGPPPDGEWTFDRPEVVDHQFALMEEGFGDLASDLRAEWGSDAGQNLEFALAASREFQANYPEVVSVIDRRGGTADPLIIEMLAVMGRQWAEVPGDPTTVRLFPFTGGHEQEATMTNTTKIQARIEELGEQIDKARLQGRTDIANLHYQEQLRLERLMPGGADPVIGSSGGPTA